MWSPPAWPGNGGAAGHPVLDGTWRYDSAAKRIIIDLAAVGAGDLYPLPLDIGIVGEGARMLMEATFLPK